MGGDGRGTTVAVIVGAAVAGSGAKLPGKAGRLAVTFGGSPTATAVGDCKAAGGGRPGSDDVCSASIQPDRSMTTPTSTTPAATRLWRVPLAGKGTRGERPSWWIRTVACLLFYTCSSTNTIDEGCILLTNSLLFRHFGHVTIGRRTALVGCCHPGQSLTVSRTTAVRGLLQRAQLGAMRPFFLRSIPLRYSPCQVHFLSIVLHEYTIYDMQ